MPSPFAITAAANTVRLDANRRGEATFTVSNVLTRRLQGRALLVTEDPTVAAWLTLVGSAERDFEVAGTQQYPVRIAAPATVPTGVYPFRLDMVGVENPDELFTQGPTVAIEVTTISPPPPPPPPQQDPGYIVTLVGTLIGAVAGGAAGTLPGILIVLISSLIEFGGDLGQAIGRILLLLVLIAIGTVLGLWIGAGVGAWFALRSRKYLGPRRTGGLVFVLLPIFFVILAAIQSALRISSGLVTLLLLLLALVGAALAGRAIALFWLKRG